MSIPIPQKKSRDSYINNPDFMPRFTKEMAEVIFPEKDIPSGFNHWLKSSLKNISIPALNCPDDALAEIYAGEIKSFGVLQKCADIILHSKPSDHAINATAFYKTIYLPIREMKDKFTAIINPAKNKIIDSLIAADSIIK